MFFQLAQYFPPVFWDPIINAITSVVGPIQQSIVPLSALASSTAGLL